MNPLNNAALVKPARTDLPADRANALSPGAAPLAFAGLLDEQQGRWSAAGGDSTAYDGSAFDVAPARRESARPAAPAAPTPAPPRAEASARSNAAPEQAPAGSDRPAARPAPAASAQNKPSAKATEARRDAGAAEGADNRQEDTAAADASAGAAAPASAGPAAPPDDVAPGTQALIEWMARWSTPVAGAPLAGGGSPTLQAAAAGAADTDGTASAAAAMAGAAASASGVMPSAADAAASLPGTAGDAVSPAPAAAPARAAGLELAAPPLAPQAATATPGGAGASIVLPTPVGAPDFSQALASQLTTLARQGVHEAQLQLNPADMGPISVQITLDGAQAQIDFAAAHARTREALEAAWPALAASLHGAGLTLGGGGVSDQRAGNREGGDASGRGPGALLAPEDGADPSAPRSVRIDAQRGLLDLYA